ncbi:aureocin A53 family class IId bacteriocin [Parageobacillus thermoglucosidasius]|uniref:Bacteriocin aureocin A53 n=2 Tax=Anoxybacillaceae TaxID=3120669 RepID=A0AAN0YSH8_PARTM|nr:aureocin A53 family class IId bacteriocin [Parageobacillus thermoglucosidasius]ANZ32284.1 bacteriocin aureocin A53 [Parageobacillus thermoglucosidasius]APM83019.1 bacteriocin aureocin A53 [Parageobacillus thermoglucosidasius]KJX67188.1 bacteriocin aureocin A53 [Parageobacillus thermoglucosidasius]RDE18601.1 bacteriocin aureocin A53 [Parageobacillus thermoglucosidasius]
MATFLRIVAQLSSKAAKWALDNKDKVLKWIRDGMAIDWIIDKINDIVG